MCSCVEHIFFVFFFFFNDTATTEIYTLSLHDALRSRRSDVGIPAVGPDHHRRTSLHGEDGVRAQHGAACGHREAEEGDLLLLLDGRMLTSEARIDAQKLRKGLLRDDDFPRLARAAGILTHAPIWIDDTAGITLLEMRSKARRLKADQGLDM